MKAKILTVLALLLGTFTNSFSQQQGTQCMSLYGGFSYVRNSNTDDTPNTLSISVNPEYGIFISNKVKLSIGVAFTHQSQNITGIGPVKTTLVGAGPSISVYCPIGEKIFIIPEVSMYYIRGAVSNKNNYIGSKTNIKSSTDVKGFAGEIIPFQIEYHPKENFGLSISLLSVEALHLEEDRASNKNNKNEINQQAFDIGLNPTVGFKFYF